ncbi:MAG: AMP-dependent synthetase/ligase [Thermoplasmata archaeon]
MKVYKGELLKAEEQTLLHSLASSFDRYSDAAAVRYPVEGEFLEIKYHELKSQVESLAAALMSMGLQKGGRALIMAQTRYEWLLADLAILFAGGITVTAFPTIPSRLLSYHILDSESKVLLFEGREQLQKFRSLEDEALKDAEVVLFDDGGGSATLASLLKREPKAAELRAITKNTSEVSPGDLASIIYTSGTTGEPKGALLTNWNIASAAMAGLQVLKARPGQTVIAFLPLAHIYQRVVCLGMLMIGGCVAFSTPRTLAEDLLIVRPEHMAAVPRLYERVYDRVLEEVERQSPMKRRIYRWAEDVALKFSHVTSGGRRPTLPLRMKHKLADRLVYAKIRDRLGGKLKYAMSGASALPPRLAYLFNGMGIRVLEGYGLTETAAPANFNPPDRVKPGTVGPPIPGIEETLAEDGEILIRGPNVFLGYNNMSKETRDAFTEDGWFRSGDLGEFDEDGYLRILGRKKQILALSTGKKVAPRPIEESLRSNPWVEDCMLLGDNRKFTSALIHPQLERLVDFLRSQGAEVREEGLLYGTGPSGDRIIVEIPDELVHRPEVTSLFESIVDEVNKDLDYHDSIKKFIILSRAFSQERDEVTPTLKKRREVIEANFKDLIEALYT